MDVIAALIVSAGFGTTSLLEGVWLLVSVPCLVYSVDCARDAWCLVRTAGSPARDQVEWWIATGTWRTEMLSHVNQQVVFTLVGLLSALTPGRPDLPAEPLAVLLALALPGLLIYVQVANAVDAYLRRRGRHRIHAYLRAEHQATLATAVAGGRRAYDPPAEEALP